MLTCQFHVVNVNGHVIVMGRTGDRIEARVWVVVASAKKRAWSYFFVSVRIYDLISHQLHKKKSLWQLRYQISKGENYRRTHVVDIIWDEMSFFYKIKRWNIMSLQLACCLPTIYVRTPFLPLHLQKWNFDKTASRGVLQKCFSNRKFQGRLYFNVGGSNAENL